MDFPSLGLRISSQVKVWVGDARSFSGLTRSPKHGFAKFSFFILVTREYGRNLELSPHSPRRHEIVH